jgi:hypothetical protein
LAYWPTGLHRSEAQRPVCPMAAKQRLIGTCVVSQARRTPLQSGSRGPESKFPHVSYGPWHVDITPARRCGRPTAWTKALQEGHSHASIAVVRLVDFERQGRRCRSQVQVRSMWKKQKVVSDGESEHNRAKYALRHTNFFSESDSQTAGLVPGSASSILTSLPPSFYDQRR